MMYTRVCALPDCGVKFETDNRRKTHCSPAHANISRQRRFQAKHRKNGGGGNGGGGNGGAHPPTLFDTISPQDSRAIYVPDTCYRTPEKPGRTPARKPVAPASSDRTEASIAKTA